MQTHTRTHASFCAKAHEAHMSHGCSPAWPQREPVATCFFEMSHLELIVSSFLDVLGHGHVGSTRLQGHGCTPTHGQRNCSCLLWEVAGRAGHEHNLKLPGLVQPWFCAVCHSQIHSKQCCVLRQPFQHSSQLSPSSSSFSSLTASGSTSHLADLLLVVMGTAWVGARHPQLLSLCNVVVSARGHARECCR